MSDENVIFILESLIGLVQGVERAHSRQVELYMKKAEGFIQAISRIDYSKVSLTHCENLLKDLTGDRAIAMGIFLNEPQGMVFPTNIGDFKIFY